MKPPPLSSVSSKTGQLKPIFLYVTNLQNSGQNRPIFQVLSQRHTSDFISYFLKFWRYSNHNKKNPHEIVIDNSNVLILAAVQAFTPFQSRNAYLDGCFDALFHKIEPKGIFIRLDRSHIVKQIKSMEILNQLDYRVKKLLQRILGYLITVDDVSVVEQIVRNLFILILNKYEHIEEVSQAKNNLKIISDDHNIDGIFGDQDIEEMSESPIENISINKESKFKNWIRNIIEEVHEKFVDQNLNDSVDTNHENAIHYNENLYYIVDKKRHSNNI